MGQRKLPAGAIVLLMITRYSRAQTQCAKSVGSGHRRGQSSDNVLHVLTYTRTHFFPSDSCVPMCYHIPPTLYDTKAFFHQEDTDNSRS